MGKCKNTTKGGSDIQKGISTTSSSDVGEAGDTGDEVHDLVDEVASLEEALSQMGASPKCPFALHDVADHHLNNLYCLNMGKVIQHKKIGLANVSKL